MEKEAVFDGVHVRLLVEKTVQKSGPSRMEIGYPSDFLYENRLRNNDGRGYFHNSVAVSLLWL